MTEARAHESDNELLRDIRDDIREYLKATLISQCIMGWIVAMIGLVLLFKL